jgi:hypothetical protein
MDGLDKVAPLLAQVPLVAIFIWYVLKTRKEDSAERIARDAQVQKFMAEQRESDRGILTSIRIEDREERKDRDDKLQSFMSEQRQADRHILTQILEGLSGIQDALMKHDSLTQKAIAKMEERTRTRKDAS